MSLNVAKLRLGFHPPVSVLIPAVFRKPTFPCYSLSSADYNANGVDVGAAHSNLFGNKAEGVGENES